MIRDRARGIPLVYEKTLQSLCIRFLGPQALERGSHWRHFSGGLSALILPTQYPSKIFIKYPKCIECCIRPRASRQHGLWQRKQSLSLSVSPLVDWEQLPRAPHSWRFDSISGFSRNDCPNGCPASFTGFLVRIKWGSLSKELSIRLVTEWTVWIRCPSIESIIKPNQIHKTYFENNGELPWWWSG